MRKNIAAVVLLLACGSVDAARCKGADGDWHPYGDPCCDFWRENACGGGADTTRTTSGESDCRADLDCWADKHRYDAVIACQRAVEQIARYDYEWIDGLLTSKFGRQGWRDSSAGVLTYAGDNIKLQNGFGAWHRYRYQCDYDPTTGSVLDVRAEPGRF